MRWDVGLKAAKEEEEEEGGGSSAAKGWLGSRRCVPGCAGHRRARAGGDRAAPGRAQAQPFPSPPRASGGSSAARATGRSRVPAAGRCQRGQVRQGTKKSSTPNGS